MNSLYVLPFSNLRLFSLELKRYLFFTVVNSESNSSFSSFHVFFFCSKKNSAQYLRYSFIITNLSVSFHSLMMAISSNFLKKFVFVKQSGLLIEFYRNKLIQINNTSLSNCKELNQVRKIKNTKKQRKCPVKVKIVNTNSSEEEQTIKQKF